MTAERPRLIRRPDPPLFSESVSRFTVRFDPDEDWTPEHFYPEIAMPPTVARSVPKRRREFIAGRYCAREAMRDLGIADAGAAVAIGRDREPIWPPGVIGSISHTQGLASAVVARADVATGIGIDIERWIERRTAEDVCDTIVTSSEIEALVSSTGWSLEEALTVAYSAKETLFKCLFATVGRYFDFKDATIDRIDTASLSFTARLVVTLAPSLSAGTRLEGCWAREADFAATGMLRLRDGSAA